MTSPLLLLNIIYSIRPLLVIFLAQHVTLNISPRLLFCFTKQPVAGAPGYITTSLLNGMSFVEGWESRFFISKWCMQQLVCFYILASHPMCIFMWTA
jgi:hypothetical protein